MTNVVVALSGGGAAGLGHIPMLQGLDDMGVRPVAYAGTSMGAIMAACAASGLPADDLRAHVLDLHRDPFAALWSFVTGVFRRDRATDLEEGLRLVLPKGMPERLEDLEVPVHLVAADYHARESKVFTSGPLIPILAASAAIPGVFAPVEIDGRLYVDGGVTNNMPVGCLPSGVLVASDTARIPPDAPGGKAPSTLDLMAGSMRILMYRQMQHELDGRPPDVFIEPGGARWDALDFGEVDEILAASDHARDDIQQKLRPLL